MKVNFFIAGVQKSGTTALDTFLRRHPQIQMASVKEVHMFDDDGAEAGKFNYNRLHSCFDWSTPNVFRGEATPIYTYWPEALSRLQEYNPNAKIIVGLRHPGYRAFSHWRMEINRRAETLTFSEAIRNGRTRVSTSPNGVHRVFSYVERGFYLNQLAELLRLFGREQVHYFRTDQLWTYPVATLNEIQAFIGVTPRTLSVGEYVVPATSNNQGEMAQEDRAYLLALFREEIDKLAMLLRLDFSDWASINYREPMEMPG